MRTGRFGIETDDIGRLSCDGSIVCSGNELAWLSVGGDPAAFAGYAPRGNGAPDMNASLASIFADGIYIGGGVLLAILIIVVLILILRR